jgi:hypothetical protein
MGPSVCLQEPTDKFGLLVQKKVDAVVKADKRVTITSSTSAKLTKTVQLFLEAE